MDGVFDLFGNVWGGGNQQQQHHQQQPRSYTFDELSQIFADPNQTTLIQDPIGIRQSLQTVLTDAHNRYGEAVRDSEESQQDLADLRKAHSGVQERARTLQAQLEQAQTQISGLTSQLIAARTQSANHSQPPPPPPPPPPIQSVTSRSPAHPNPEKFGNARRTPADFKIWLIGLNVKMYENRDWWDTERSRMNFVLSMLEGDAARQFHPYLNDDGTFKGNMDSVEKMLSVLRQTFGNSYSRSDSWGLLKKERQGQRSTGEFLASFLALYAASGQEGYAVIDILLDNVHPAIKRGILADREFTETTSVEELVTMIRRQDQILKRSYGDAFIKTTNPETSHVNIPPTTTSLATPRTTATDGDPMDLSVMRVGGKLVWTKRDVDEKKRALTQEEKDARRAYQTLHDLCRFCDSPHHKIIGCPKLKAKEARDEKAKADKNGDEDKDEGKGKGKA